MSTSHRSRPCSRLVAAAIVAATCVVAPTTSRPAVVAAGTPDISLQASSPGGVLYGAEIPITLTASNAGGPDGFNLSFRDVLPVGVSYVPGSSSPSPTVVVRGDGTTSLTWSNVSDLLTGTTSSLTYRLAVSQAVYDVDDVIATAPGAYVNADPRFVPDFDGNGDPIAGPASYTGSDTATTATTLLPFEITKSEPNAEAELLRGVHDHQTVYTIRVDNNLVNPTTGFAIVDFVPAGLEFLGCGGVDNTTPGVEEYPGSLRIDEPGNVPALANPCPVPSSVTTVTTDPDGAGPLPNAVYTRVEWNAAALAATFGSADLAPSGSFRFDYVAAVPLRQNVQATLTDPTANLDNNTGTLTFDEQQLTNHAIATGTYDARPTPSTDADSLTVSAEDVSIHKSASTGSFVQGSSTTWTLFVESSEYALSTGPITVTDTIPDGLDFDLGSAVPAQDSGFPVAGPAGTQLVQWTLPGFASPTSTATITFDTTTRTDYRVGGPVSANDSWTNTVDLTANATVITDNAGGTSVLPVVDGSSAGQSAGGLTILKEVSEPAATLTCGDGLGVTFHPDAPPPPGAYRPGDRVCFRLSVDFPGQLDTLEPLVQDYLPPGFAFDSWAPGDGDDDIALGSTFTPPGPGESLLEWELGPAVDTGGLRFEAVVQAVIVDPAVAADGDILSNLMKFRYRNTDGSVFQARDLADVPWAEPELTVNKGVVAVDGVAVPGAPADNVLVQNGEVVTYQVRVDNGGSVDALSVDVRDTLPPGIDCGAITNIGAGGTCDVANTRIDWPAALGLTVPAGSSLALTYDLTVPVGTSAGALFDNVAGVRTYEGPTNDPGDPTFQYVPSANIDPPLEPTANTDPAIDGSRIRTGTPTITKTRTTGITATGNSASQATIGETITYTVTVDLPGGTAYYGPAAITDVLSATRLDLDETSLSVTLDGGPLPLGFSTSTAANTVTITFPGDAVTPYETPTDDPQTIVATFDAVVTDVVANARPGSVPNRADFDYDDAGGTGRNVNASVNTQIVEPNLSLAKTNDDADGIVDAGQTILYTVTVGNTNGTRVSSAYDVVVVDTVPSQLTVLEAPGDPAEDGDVIAPDGGIWNAGARTITWTVVAPIAPGASVPLRYQVRSADPLVASGPLTNDAVATATSIAGVVAGERDGTTTLPGYRATASDTVVAPTLSVVKSGTPDSATVGEPIVYTLDVTIPGGVVAYDVTVIDDLPPGIAYESFTSIACDQGGGPCSPDITAASVTTDGDVVSFFLGDQTTAASAARVVTITYVAVVDDVGAASAGATLTNTATAYFNATDVLGTPASPPDPSGFDESSDPAGDDVDVVEPSLSIDKDVAGQVGDLDTRRAKPGDTLTFTVVVTNAGGADVGDAYDLTVTDTPDPRLTGYSFTPVAGVVNTDADPSDGDLEWTVAGPLAPGASVTISYQLTVPATFDSGEENPAGFELSNTADVPSYFGVDATTRAANPGRAYREYDDVAPDTVQIELDLASIGDVLWYDVDGDGVVDAGEPRLADIDVTVTYLGPNGVLGGGDDEAVTVSTDASGVYVVDRLPGGSYRVEVDETDPQFVAGLVPSYDLDGGVLSPDGVWLGSLGEAADRRDVDFGYTGDGSIGDTIWFDQDGDGIQDAGEAGLPGVGVVVTWFGPDGVAGGGDDLVYPAATTGAGGSYLVDRLPAGNFSVVVQAGTVPAGYSIVTDPQGAVDGTALVTLTAGEDDLGQDFGYRGSGSIGDTVYLDRNGDGDQDPGEPGLAGVTVVVDHAGPDGIAGNGDDSTFTAVTDANGNYLVEFLPPGSYTVTITGGLPANVTNSDDPDSAAPGDSTADLTLANGADDLAQDFGYAATSVLGDRVWWDLNGDGVQDPGEPGLNGVTVTASGPNGLTFSTVTSGDGDYLFSNIPDGDWTVTVTAGLPAGLAPSYDSDGTGTPGTSDLTLATSDLTQDFGYVGNSTIGDRLWLDRDGDGVQDVGEPGIEAVTVDLTWYGPDGVAGGGDDIVVTTSTDANGNYRFEGLPAGNYSVAVDETDPDFSVGLAVTFDRDGTTVTPDGVTPVTLGAAEDVDDVDFGYRGGGSIGDLVWFDRDGDGVQDIDEPGLGGIDITLVWFGEDGVLGTADDESFATVTDAAGVYGFDGLPAGTYDVTVDVADLPAGMQATSDADGGLDDTSRLVLADGEVDLGQDFGYHGAGSVGDTVWFDLDGDGVQDPGEPGIPGQTVDVTWAGPGGPVTFTTVTDADGNYLVTGLPDGDVTVTIVGGVATTATNSGDPDGGGDSTSVVTLTGGSSDLDQDFGYVGVNAVGDRVWFDLDADGVQDVGEPGLPGVEVTLTWFGVDGVPGGDDLSFTTLTDVAGGYLFANLPDGSYEVAVTAGLPLGLTTGTYDEDDGTAGPDGTTVVTDLGVSDPAAVVHLTADFGFAGTGTIGDTVWLDLDGNGVQASGEPGIPAVTVTLTWAGIDDTLGTSDDVVYPTIATDGDGGYLFEHLPAGEFRVDLTGVDPALSPSSDPDGGGDDSSTLVLAAGASDLDQDFGYVGDAGLGDRVWLDVDGDGVQDPGEPGLPGVTVTVVTPGADGVVGTADDITITVETGADGRYLVIGLPAATTDVSYDPADLAAGLVPDSDLDGGPATSTSVDLAPGDDRRDVDFGVVGDATIDGVVFDDRDGDGVQDPGEPGIPGVEIEVVWNGPDGPVVLTAVTGPDGTWRITSLPAGEYDVTIDVATLPDGVVMTTPVDVSVVVPPGGTATVVHGATPGASVGDRIWNDSDRDGVQDAGEPGIAGVVVRLLDADGDVVASTTTDGTGGYSFDDLTPGVYTVVVDTSTVPTGYVQTGDPDSTFDGRSTVTLAAGEDDTTTDFGFAPRRSTTMPSTGSDSGRPLELAALLTLVGVALVLGGRRRGGSVVAG